MLIHQGRIACAFSPGRKYPGKQKVNAQSMAEKAKLRGKTQKSSSVQSQSPVPGILGKGPVTHLPISTREEHSSPSAKTTRSFLLETAVPLALAMTVIFHTPNIGNWHSMTPLCWLHSLSPSARTGAALHVGVVPWGITFSHRPQGVNRRKISYC